MGIRGMRFKSQKEKRIIKTLIAFIILGSLSYGEEIKEGNLAEGTFQNDIFLGKNEGKGTMHSKGDGKTHTYDFKGNVTINGSKIDDKTPIISNQGKDNINISLEKDKTMTVDSENSEKGVIIIKATSEKNDRKSININDKNNKNGNLVFENKSSDKNKSSEWDGYTTILAENSDVNIFAENYKSSNYDGIKAKNNGKINIDLSGNFEINDNRENNIIDNEAINAKDNSEVNISANNINLNSKKHILLNKNSKVTLNANNITIKSLSLENSSIQHPYAKLITEEGTTNLYAKDTISFEGKVQSEYDESIRLSRGEANIISGNKIYAKNFEFTNYNSEELDKDSVMNIKSNIIELNNSNIRVGSPYGMTGKTETNIEANIFKGKDVTLGTSGGSGILNLKADELILDKTSNKKGLGIYAGDGKLTIDTKRNKITFSDTNIEDEYDFYKIVASTVGIDAAEGPTGGKGELIIKSDKNIIEAELKALNKSEINIKFNGDFDETGVKSSFLGYTTLNNYYEWNPDGIINLEFSDGAYWNIFNPKTVNGPDISEVTSLTLNNGIVNFNYEEKDRNIKEKAYDLVIHNLKGNGGTFIIGASGNDINHKENTYEEERETDFIDIKNADEKQTHFVQIAENSIDKVISHDFEDGKKGIWFADADENVTFEGKELQSLSSIYDYDIIVDKNLEGRDPSKNGNNWYITNLVEKENETVTSAKENMAFLYQTAISRLEVESMHERMGEIRNYENTNGVWFKTSSGKMNADDFGNDYNLIQVGYDRQKDVKDGKVFTGIAVNRRQNKLDLTAGDGESENIGVSLYKSFAGNDGKYFDVLAKTTYIDTDYKISNGTENMNADYNTWAETLSMEVGKKYSSETDKWYVTPHAQINYSFIKGADYTTNTDIKVKQGDINSLIGKVGVYAGKDFEKSSHYIKVAGLYEALGDYKIDMTDKVNSKPYSDKLDGKDSWAEIGIGGTFQVGKSGTTHMYYNVERTLGSEYETQWEGTLGIRMTF